MNLVTTASNTTNTTPNYSDKIVIKILISTITIITVTAVTITKIHIASIITTTTTMIPFNTMTILPSS